MPRQEPVQVLRTGVPGKIVTTPNGILIGMIRIGAAPHGHIGNLRDFTAVKARCLTQNISCNSEYNLFCDLVSVQFDVIRVNFHMLLLSSSDV